MSAPFEVLTIDLTARRLANAGELRELCERTGPQGIVAVVAVGEAPAVVEGWVALLDDADAVAHVEPLTDALQRVDPSGLVLGAVDRSPYGRFGLPQVLRAEVLRVSIDDLAPAAEVDPAGAVLATGGVVRAGPRDRPRPL